MNYTNSSRQFLHIDDIAEELLLEIFKWIPFDELSSNVKLVSKRWYKIASTASLRPDALVITDESRWKTVFRTLSKYNDTLLSIKFQDIHKSRIISVLNLKQWSNLRTLSMKWKYQMLDGVSMSIPYLNHVIDRCPKLSGIELRECFVYGDMNMMVEKLQERGIGELTVMNAYLVVNGIEKLFSLRHMTKFQVHCYPFGNLNSSICTFCQNNQHSLTSLALRIENRSSENDVINAIASCYMLRKLHLIGQFNVSDEGLRKIAELEKLRCLKIQVHLIGCDKFAMLLRSPFTRQLSVLSVHWSRPVTEEELVCITNCINLTKLTLKFSDYFNDTEMISDVVIQLVRELRLKKLKIISNSAIIDFLPNICLQGNDLFCIKLIHNYDDKHLKALRWKLQDVNATYKYTYCVRKAEVQIVLRKRILCDAKRG